MQPADFELKPWPPVRNLIAEHLSVARKTNQIHGMAESDITPLNKMPSAQRKAGKVYALTAFFLYNLVKAIK